ncbi:MAG: methylmalonyl Co-A mutase-associated GTPase MeaB [Armatimonadetes bacterium]|nr:methylmalonyl Co-A mutase-associated GTPase MeaB [Armatimonadota bacterium]
MSQPRSAPAAADLAAQVLAGSHQAAARLISLVENRQREGLEALRTLYPRTGRAHSVGITGPPGAGKSTLVDALTRRIRAEGGTVGIVAVDPTSPFTGGAVLGDRVRMQDHATDPGVFVRSMATRGALGGLAPATGDVIHILDALGCAFILIETVGAGQGEVDVAAAADTVILVTVPGLGDTVQTLKAGIMEIGDLFVVNKADRPEADRAVTEIKMMLGLAPDRGWRPPVLKTVAVSGEGVEEVLAAVRAHRSHLETSGALQKRRRERRRGEVLRALEGRIREEVLTRARQSGLLDQVLDKVAQGALDPYAAVDHLLRPM